MRRRMGHAVALVTLLAGLTVSAAPASRAGLDLISGDDLRRWLSYLASDTLQGRATFSEGQGLAAAYIADHLREWGVRPGGDNGSFLQAVRVLGVRATSRSSVTVDVGGRSRTFRDGDGVMFPKNVGGKRRFDVDRVEFLGYGLGVMEAGSVDRAERSAKRAVVWLGPAGPKTLDSTRYRRVLTGRARYATDEMGALAAIGPVALPALPGDDAHQPPAGEPGPPGGDQTTRVDFTTAQRLDAPKPPAVTAQDEFFEFLFSGAPVPYEQLRAKASEREPLPSFTLEGVRLTFDLDADYEVVRTQITHNVIGIVPGADARLRDSYVAFGAHYDHVGYAEGELLSGPNGLRRAGAVGVVTAGALEDRVWNGADDDGSGTVAMLSLAKAFSLGPRTKRSVLMVWHTGEERGLWGSRYFADYPKVPLGDVVAQLNLDMIGRNRHDKPDERHTVYAVGSDRISSELHQLHAEANASLPQPLTLDYELNDPADPEQLYYRSDHYSYAAKGIPIIFFTTGLHADYHANTDEVDKIDFDKMTRVTQLVYETGRRLGNLDHAAVRDHRGPRTGRSTLHP